MRGRRLVLNSGSYLCARDQPLVVLHLEQRGHLRVQALLALLLHGKLFRAHHSCARPAPSGSSDAQAGLHQRFEFFHVQEMRIGHGIERGQQLVEQRGIRRVHVRLL